MSSIVSLRANEARGGGVFAYLPFFSKSHPPTGGYHIMALKELLPNLYGDVDRSGPSKGVG